MAAPMPDSTGLAIVKAALDLPDKVLDLGCDLVRDLFGSEPVKVATGMLSDQLYWWQWRNRVRIASRAAEIMDLDGIARRVVPPAFLLPLLDAAGNVEDPELQGIWARLLASGTADNRHQHPILINVLRQIDGNDAKTFAAVCADSDERKITFADLKVRRLWNDDAVTASHARLEALGLIIIGAVDPARAQFGSFDDFPGETLIAPTRLGVQFRAAVMPQDASKPEA